MTIQRHFAKLIKVKIVRVSGSALAGVKAMNSGGFEPVGRLLVLLGLFLVLLGLFLVYGKHIPFLGRLPGDIRIERDNFAFYFPITTSILLSILLSLLLYLFGRR